jgi:hypothetical protein
MAARIEALAAIWPANCAAVKARMRPAERPASTYR